MRGNYGNSGEIWEIGNIVGHCELLVYRWARALCARHNILMRRVPNEQRIVFTGLECVPRRVMAFPISSALPRLWRGYLCISLCAVAVFVCALLGSSICSLAEEIQNELKVLFQKKYEIMPIFQAEMSEEIFIFLQFPFANGFLQRLFSGKSRELKVWKNTKLFKKYLFLRKALFFNQKSSKDLKINIVFKTIILLRRIFFLLFFYNLKKEKKLIPDGV